MCYSPIVVALCPYRITTTNIECAVLTEVCRVEFQKLYMIDFNFNIFCGTPNDIWRCSSVLRRIVWEPLV